MFESLCEWPPAPPECAPEWLDAYDEATAEDPWTDADVLAEATARPAGSGLLLRLMQVDLAALSADQVVEFAQQVERFAAFAAGLQAAARAEAMARLVEVFGEESHQNGTGFATPEMLASAELAAALRMAPRTVDAQFEHACDLSGPLLPLRKAMVAGLISASHASAIARELRRLPSWRDPALAEAFAAHCDRILDIVVSYATEHTPGQSARRTRALVVATCPRGAAKQQREAAELEHGVWLTPTEAGSCELTAVMPLGHGQALMDAITTLARDERFETAEGCVTSGQRRVAALATLVLGDPGSVARVEGPVAEAKVTARVNVIVPVEALLTNDEAAPGGAIAGEAVTAEVIRELVTKASPTSTVRRLFADSTGCIIDAGRTRYAISDTQRYLIALRDGTCRFPGCSRSASRCEIDHATAWDDGGGTDLDNLGALCKQHHQLKTHGGWRITSSQRSGACTWRSPLGRVYEHTPPGLTPPKPVTAETPPF
jgi:hypothetical protein